MHRLWYAHWYAHCPIAAAAAAASGRAHWYGSLDGGRVIVRVGFLVGRQRRGQLLAL
jgi:hypothetical protein